MRSPGTEVLLFLFVVVGHFISQSTATNTSFVSSAKGKLKILGIFGHLGKSHFDVFKPLVLELARRGHEVTVVSHYPRTTEEKAQDPLPTYEDIDLHDEKVGLFLGVVDVAKVDFSIFRMPIELGSLRNMANVACEIGLRNPRLIELVNSGKKYDIVITESFNTDCFLAVVHKFNAPSIAISSHQLMIWANEQMDNPHAASYMPNILQGIVRPLSFFERVLNVLFIGYGNVVYNTWFHYVDQSLVKEVYGPGVPNLRDIARNISLIMVNTHYSLHGMRPNLPSVIEVGGIHIPQKTKPLPRDIANFLDEAHEGVLYFNLGSMVKASTIPKEKLAIIVKVLRELPRKVIWKFEGDDLPQLDNVLIRKWLPQFDILSHPNVKCYFGHGGLLGLSEGVYVGVPMVLLPIFGDQFHNAAAAETRGAAIVLKFNELNENALRHALDEVFNNTRYRENAQKLSKAYRDRPASPLETAVWWTEYIARGNGLPYLKSEGADLPWYQRHLLDVAFFLLGVSLAFLFGLYRLLKLLVSGFFGGTKQKGSVDRKKSKKRD